VSGAAQGYLERLREICTRHDILLIFDEVITGFGRLGTPFAVDYFGVVPDMICTAKGITNGVIPMGGVFCSSDIYDAFMTGPEHAIELFHGYTYSAHPVACAASMATLDIYANEGLLNRGPELAQYFEDALHSLKGLPHVIDIRNIGLVSAIELRPMDGEPTKRAFSAFLNAYEKGVMMRTTGDIIALSPPLIVSKSEIDFLVSVIADVLKTCPDRQAFRYGSPTAPAGSPAGVCHSSRLVSLRPSNISFMLCSVVADREETAMTKHGSFCWNELMTPDVAAAKAFMARPSAGPSPTRTWARRAFTRWLTLTGRRMRWPAFTTGRRASQARATGFPMSPSTTSMRRLPRSSRLVAR
jgi:Adenosylmethionine-8-amino-7-oxononanoate aminotransferase